MSLLPLASRQANWLWRTQKLRAVAREAQIPYTTLWRTAREGRPLPEQYRAGLRRVFQRGAYSGFREQGMSAGQARRFSWYTPEGVDDYRDRMAKVVNFYTDGAYKKRIWKLDKEGVKYNNVDVRDEMREKVKEGLRNSRKTIEDWEKYSE